MWRPYRTRDDLLGLTWGDAPGYHIWAPLGRLGEPAGVVRGGRCPRLV